MQPILQLVCFEGVFLRSDAANPCFRAVRGEIPFDFAKILRTKILDTDIELDYFS